MGINEASFLIRVSDPAKLDFEAVRTVNMTLVARYILLLCSFGTVSNIAHMSAVNTMTIFVNTRVAIVSQVRLEIKLLRWMINKCSRQ